jgi:hypothetical protein
VITHKRPTIILIPVVYSSSVSESSTYIDPRPSEDEKLELENSEDENEESEEYGEDESDENINVPIWCV